MIPEQLGMNRLTMAISMPASGYRRFAPSTAAAIAGHQWFALKNQVNLLPNIRRLTLHSRVHTDLLEPDSMFQVSDYNGSSSHERIWQRLVGFLLHVRRGAVAEGCACKTRLSGGHVMSIRSFSEASVPVFQNF